MSKSTMPITTMQIGMAQQYRNEVMRSPEYIDSVVGKKNSNASVEVIIGQDNSINVCILLDKNRFERKFADGNELRKELNPPRSEIDKHRAALKSVASENSEKPSENLDEIARNQTPRP